MPEPLQKRGDADFALRAIDCKIESGEGRLFNGIGGENGLRHLLKVVDCAIPICAASAGSAAISFSAGQRDADDAGRGREDFFGRAAEDLGGRCAGGAGRVQCPPARRRSWRCPALMATTRTLPPVAREIFLVDDAAARP